MSTEKTAKKYSKQVQFNRALQLVRMGALKNLPPGVSQREIDWKWVDTLWSEFDLDKVKTPHVSHRDGYYWIVDGQHTIELIKRFLGDGWKEQNLECYVYEGLSPKDEADKFDSLNTQKSQSTFNRYKVRVTAERQTELQIESILGSLGLVSSTQSTPGAVGAVGTLIKAFKRDGGQALGRALKLTHEAYGDPGLEAVVIDGFSMMCHRYNGVLDEGKSINSLSGLKGGVKGLLGLAEQLRLKTGGRKAECVAASAVNIINRDRIGKSKLPTWFK
jgi:hypothetical protein